MEDQTLKSVNETEAVQDDSLSPFDDIVNEMSEQQNAPIEPPAADSTPSRRRSKRRRTARRGAGSYDDSREVIGQKAREVREERQSKASTIAAFRSALAKADTILEGRVASATIYEGKACWMIYENQVTVYIPLTEAFQVVPKTLLTFSDERALRNQRNFMYAAVGATVNYCVTSFSATAEGEFVAYGSRVKAMQQIRRRYFGNNAALKVFPEANVVCRVLSTGNNAIYVDACGLDVKVENHDLSFRYIEDASQLFHPGDKVTLQVREVGVADDGTPTLTLDGKPIELVRARAVSYRVKRDSLYQGTVTSLRSDRKKDKTPSTVVFLYLDDVEVPAWCRDFRMNDPLTTGDKVLFQAHGISQDGFAHGSIVRKLF